MIPEPPPGQGPIDPRGAFSPPPPPGTMPPPPARGAMPMPPPPPGWMPPPMMMMPPPPAPRQRGFVRGIFTTLALTIFGLSLMLNVYLLIATIGLSSAGGAIRQTTLVTGDLTQKVAVVPIKGVIMEAEADQFDRFMKQVEEDANVKALVIDVDTPGGSVTASDEIYERIRKVKASKGSNFPVVVTMGGMATSGGYYVSCAADYIFAQPTTLTGNIGVLLPRFNVSKLADKWGIEDTTIASTGAIFKNAGSMFKPEKPEETQYFQGIADEAFAQFKTVIKDGRGANLKQPIDQIANGKVYMQKEALALGLIDEKGYADDAYTYAAKHAGLNKMTIVRYQKPAGLLGEMLGASSTLSPPIGKGAGSVSINGVNVNLDTKALNDLLTPRLLYLWRGN